MHIGMSVLVKENGKIKEGKVKEIYPEDERDESMVEKHT